MYGLHKTILVLVTLLCWGISFIFKVDYSIIASEGITIISIILAIYMTSFSSLVSSKLADKMSKTQDKQLRGKSELGVLKGYLNVAVKFGIVNIVIGCILLLMKNKLKANINRNIVYNILSATGISNLADNIFLMYVLFIFMINRQLWNK